MENKTNKYGANGTTSDPREQVAWDFYVESITRGQENAYESAIKANYSEDSARNITMRDWFKERLGKLRKRDLLSKAEKVLNDTLDYVPVDEEGKVNVPLLAVQTKVATTIATTLGKDEGYSTRQEITGANGKDFIPDEETKKRSDNVLDKFLKGTAK